MRAVTEWGADMKGHAVSRNVGSLLLVCGCAWLGGSSGGWLFSPGEHARFETVHVTGNFVVGADAQQGEGCRLLPCGTLTATRGIMANQIRGQVVSCQSLFAATNPLSASFDDQEILAQIVADPQSGGRIVALNRAATLVPRRGAPTGGQAARIRFHPQNGAPEVFTHDLAQGEAGKAFMLSMRPEVVAGGSGQELAQPVQTR